MRGLLSCRGNMMRIQTAGWIFVCQPYLWTLWSLQLLSHLLAKVFVATSSCICECQFCSSKLRKWSCSKQRPMAQLSIIWSYPGCDRLGSFQRRQNSPSDKCINKGLWLGRRGWTDQLAFRFQIQSLILHSYLSCWPLRSGPSMFSLCFSLLFWLECNWIHSWCLAWLSSGSLSLQDMLLTLFGSLPLRSTHLLSATVRVDFSCWILSTKFLPTSYNHQTLFL